MSSECQRTTPTTARLAMALVGALGVLVLFELSPELEKLFEPLNVAVARVTAWLLGLVEMPVIRQGTILAHSDGFSYRIGYVCSGIRPAVLIGVAMLMVRATWTQQLVGIAVALVGIEILNFSRLIHLYWVGVNQPESYFTAHRVTWNIIAISAGIAYFGIWLHLTRRPVKARDMLPTASHAQK